MANYNLQPDEAVILKDENVAYGGVLPTYTNELLLTNLNLVLLRKGILGNGKGYHLFPIDQVKVYDGQAQALVGRRVNRKPLLEVYFVNSQEVFDFQSGGKRKVLNWTAKINQVVTGNDLAATNDAVKTLPGADTVASMLKDTVGVFKTRFGSTMDDPVRTGKCSACGAPVSGTGALAITCEYCGTVQES